MEKTVLHLIDSTGMYGAEAVVLDLMAEQKRKGIVPILGSIGETDIQDKEIEKIAEQRSLEVKKFRMKNGLNILGAMRIARFASNNKMDLIHCHGYKPNILMGLIPKRVRRVPYLVTMHGWTTTNSFSKMGVYSWLDAIMVKRADMAVVVSQSMMNHPKVRAIGLKTIVIHNGVRSPADDDSNISSEKHFLNGFKPKGMIIGAVGRLAPEKGFEVLIEAVAELAREGYNVSLVIIGEGRERQKLEDLSYKRGIADRVLLAGYHHHVNRQLNYFDVFVLSSLSEGLPITLLEAMEAGLPIIATSVGGVPEALDNGKCGLLVSRGSSHEIAKAFMKLYESPDLRYRLGNLAKKRVRNEFTVEKMALEYLKIYEKILGSNPCSAV
jgi:glycosyltransferase involved in cell wall biosynthesis